jgi:hypothetical protein
LILPDLRVLPRLSSVSDEINLKRGVTSSHVPQSHGHSDYSPWLFLGGKPGQPPGLQALMRRLQRLEIHARPARNTSFEELVADLTNGVLSRLLGVHINTAEKQMRQAGRLEAEYAAEVLRRSRPRP